MADGRGGGAPALVALHRGGDVDEGPLALAQQEGPGGRGPVAPSGLGRRRVGLLPLFRALAISIRRNSSVPRCPPSVSLSLSPSCGSPAAGSFPAAEVGGQHKRKKRSHKLEE